MKLHPSLPDPSHKVLCFRPNRHRIENLSRVFCSAVFNERVALWRTKCVCKNEAKPFAREKCPAICCSWDDRMGVRFAFKNTKTVSRKYGHTVSNTVRYLLHKYHIWKTLNTRLTTVQQITDYYYYFYDRHPRTCCTPIRYGRLITRDGR